eukprot:NODE_77_length_23338_cov_0.319463.p9 type:complete len:190 gc:universal NODE_77_length_23338_cov_0.319463:4013-3444(-)
MSRLPNVENCVASIQEFKTVLKQVSSDILNGSPDLDGLQRLNNQIQCELNVIHEHQMNHKEINKLYQKIFSESEQNVLKIDELQKDYKESVQILREIEYLNSLKVPKFDNINDFVKECARLTIYTSGPPSDKFKSGIPFPTEDMMKLSKLFNLTPVQPKILVQDVVSEEKSFRNSVVSSDDEGIMDLDL